MRLISVKYLTLITKLLTNDKTANIQYAIIAGFCGRLKHCARKKHLCNFETIVP